jgi:hypothetical protein
MSTLSFRHVAGHSFRSILCSWFDIERIHLCRRPSPWCSGVCLCLRLLHFRGRHLRTNDPSFPPSTTLHHRQNYRSDRVVG